MVIDLHSVRNVWCSLRTVHTTMTKRSPAIIRNDKRWRFSTEQTTTWPELPVTLHTRQHTHSNSHIASQARCVSDYVLLTNAVKRQEEPWRDSEWSIARSLPSHSPPNVKIEHSSCVETRWSEGEREHVRTWVMSEASILQCDASSNAIIKDMQIKYSKVIQKLI
jgi:hypothetical protein